MPFAELAPVPVFATERLSTIKAIPEKKVPNQPSLSLWNGFGFSRRIGYFIFWKSLKCRQVRRAQRRRDELPRPPAPLHPTSDNATGAASSIRPLLFVQQAVLG
jgi:hypothetical protein